MSIKNELKKVKNHVEVPTVLQMEATECGAACLAMILASYGSYIPLEQLRKECGINRDGSRVSNINKAACRNGLIAKAYCMEAEGLLDVRMPCIIHWNFNHFVVLEGFKKGNVYINDPAGGRRAITWEELDRSFTGVVLVYAPAADFERKGVEPQLYRALTGRLKGSEVTLIFLLLTGLFLVIPGLVIPAFSIVFVDDILLDQKIGWLNALIWGMIITLIIQGILTYMQQSCLVKMNTKIAVITSGKFLWHVLRLPLEFFTQRYAGDISQRMQNNDTIAAFLSGQLASTVINCVMLVFYLALMAAYDWKLALLALAAALINLLYLKYVSRKRADLNRKQQQDNGKMMGVAMGGLQMIETLKASGSENDFFSRVAGFHAKNLVNQQTFGVSTQYLNTLPILLTALTDAAILITGGFEVINGVMTVGTLVAFRFLASSFMSPLTTLMQIGSQYQEMKADIERLDDVLKYEQDDVFKQKTDNMDMFDDARHQRLAGRIDIENMSFGYNQLEEPFIQDFNLHMEPGMRVALVGGSGSGKSTISKLISGIYSPWDGSIMFDGHSRETIQRTVLNNSLSVVDQDICLFADTVKNNITLWDSTMPDDLVFDAVKDAEIFDAIVAKKGGFGYMLEEDGKNFSGGQRQRIEIARALVGNPSILIMDEATSALDPVTEKKISDNIRDRGCSCIIVAHRLSTIRDCDEIIVLNQGKTVQRGTHDLLKDQDGPYRDLIKTL